MAAGAGVVTGTLGRGREAVWQMPGEMNLGVTQVLWLLGTLVCWAVCHMVS